MIDQLQTGKACNQDVIRPLGRSPDFLKLWAALSGSLVGSQMTALAIPLIAALELGASPLQMGAFAAASQASYLLVSLPAGYFLDRMRRRPVMIATDVGCALLLLSIPIVAITGTIGFVHLCVVAAGVGVLGALGEIAHMAYAPSLISRERLVDANSRIQVSHSVADSAGPGLGGFLVQLVGAPLAILTDAVSYAVSACLIASIDQPEPHPRSHKAAQPLRQELAEGFRLLLTHPLLRPIMWSSMASTLLSSGIMALYILYATRDLGLSPLGIGLIFATGGLCVVPGALLADWAGRRIGIGLAITWGWLIEAVAWLLIPLAVGPTALVILVLGLARVLEGTTGTLANIHQWTLRQALTPDHLHGRVTASHRFLVYGAGAIGALLGGVLGSFLDLRVAILLCAGGAFLVRLATFFTPLRSLRALPAPID